MFESIRNLFFPPSAPEAPAPTGEWGLTPTDQTPPIDWRAKYDRAHERELRQMRRAEKAEAALEDARRITATQGDKIMRQRDAFKKIAASEAKAGSAMKLANIARAELVMPLRTMSRAERKKEQA